MYMYTHRFTRITVRRDRSEFGYSEARRRNGCGAAWLRSAAQTQGQCISWLPYADSYGAFQYEQPCGHHGIPWWPHGCPYWNVPYESAYGHHHIHCPCVCAAAAVNMHIYICNGYGLWYVYTTNGIHMRDKERMTHVLVHISVFVCTATSCGSM